MKRKKYNGRGMIKEERATELRDCIKKLKNKQKIEMQTRVE